MNAKQRIINKIIATEGGYVNDTSDSGGETNYGITKSVARDNGYFGDMMGLPIQLAFRIYAEKYWDSLGLDDVAVISEAVAEELADTGVNMGVIRSGEFFQRALNVLNNNGALYPGLAVDGVVGDKTIAAFKHFYLIREGAGISVMLKMLDSLQGAFYISLAERRQKDQKFIFGWFVNRVA